jgi:prefoldin subunit 5
MENNQTENKLNIIIDKLTHIETQVAEIKSRVTEIETTLNIINTSSQNMDEHIDFIENVYNVVKNPLASFIQYYYGKNTVKIEDITKLTQHHKRLN